MEEAGPSIISLAHVPDVGEWRIVQTARGNRKGLEPQAPLNFIKVSHKTLGLSIGFVLPSKGTGASFYRKIVLGGMYKVAALRL